ncbi:hypothetical protein HN385_00455 [archaeon]|jgi:DNA repair protein NreA|nr:hypothetical protein [archaeon]MBT3451606.1 hypothetical protein [archaeon]MBT6869626.1 hypothetical protein [archaeon]MBT7192395.1 hypothetical protein [archaeon]MBT7380196.1 hypothetical protein [archaeon]
MQIQRVKYKDIEQIPHIQTNKKFKQDFFGSSPAPFIGRVGYPNINIGILSPQFSGDTSYYDSPKLWSKASFKIGQVASLRYGLVNSRTNWNVKNVMNRHNQITKNNFSDIDNTNNILTKKSSLFNKTQKFIDLCQEVGMAKKSAELEINLEKNPKLQFKPEKEIIPFGPQSQVKSAKITSNTKVDQKVERVVSDTDLKATPAILNLYQKGFEETSLNKLISVGNLGIGKNRKLVPTRWSITAVDDIISKDLIKEIKQYPADSDYKLYFGGDWGNYYLILFYPDVWSYELFETYLEKKVNPWSKNGFLYSTDYENFKGRKTYAEECAGGYYAARLPVLEKMKLNKKQNSALVLRFITPEYNVPLGVWVCREATRKSLTSREISFSDEKLMVNYAKEIVKNKFGFDLNLLLTKSQLLKSRKTQTKLIDY